MAQDEDWDEAGWDELDDDFDGADFDEDDLEAFDADSDPEAEAFNPAVTGIGHWPKQEDEEDWIEAACDAINDYGARAYLRRMLRELRLAFVHDQVLSSVALDDQEMLDHVLGHLLGAQVAGYESVKDVADLPGMLYFDDGHAIPCIPAPAAARTRRSDLRALAGLRLAGAGVGRPKRGRGQGERYLWLYFHPNPARESQIADAWQADEWAELERQVEALAADTRTLRVAVAWHAGAMILCPGSEHADEGLPERVGALPEGEMQDLEAAAHEVEFHLARRRVADILRPPDGSRALVFDDQHVLPILPPPGIPAPGPEALEEIIGRFLVMARPGPEGLVLHFHDDPERAEKLRQFVTEAEASSGDANGEVQAFVEEGPTLVTSAASAARLACPGPIAHGDLVP